MARAGIAARAVVPASNRDNPALAELRIGKTWSGRIAKNPRTALTLKGMFRCSWFIIGGTASLASLAHPMFLDQLERCLASVVRAKQSEPEGWRRKADVQTLGAVHILAFDRLPRDPLSHNLLWRYDTL